MALTNEQVTANVDISLNTRKRFTVDHNVNKIIELDVADLSIVSRLSEAVKRIDEIQADWDALVQQSHTLKDSESVDTNSVDTFSNDFLALESKMRDLIDYVFDSPDLCETILGDASIFSPINGKFKYEQIISTLMGLYEENIKVEADKINKRKVQSKVARYKNR